MVVIQNYLLMVILVVNSLKGLVFRISFKVNVRSIQISKVTILKSPKYILLCQLSVLWIKSMHLGPKSEINLLTARH